MKIGIASCEARDQSYLIPIETSGQAPRLNIITFLIPIPVYLSDQAA